MDMAIVNDNVNLALDLVSIIASYCVPVCFVFGLTNLIISTVVRVGFTGKFEIKL